MVSGNTHDIDVKRQLSLILLKGMTVPISAQHNQCNYSKSDAGPYKKHLPVVNLFLTRESLYS